MGSRCLFPLCMLVVLFPSYVQNEDLSNRQKFLSYSKKYQSYKKERVRFVCLGYNVSVK